MEKFIGYVLGIVIVLVGVALIVLLVSFPVMLLWNFVVPSIFGLGTITLIQSVALNMLSAMLLRGSVGKALMEATED